MSEEAVHIGPKRAPEAYLAKVQRLIGHDLTPAELHFVGLCYADGKTEGRTVALIRAARENATVKA